MFGSNDRERAQAMKEEICGSPDAAERFSRTDEAVELLHHDDATVREDAAETLSYVATRNDESAQNVFGIGEHLIEHVDDDSETVRKNCVDALAGIALTDSSPLTDELSTVAKTLSDSSESVRYRAALLFQAVAILHPQAIEPYRNRLQELSDGDGSASGPAEHAIELLDATVVKRCPNCGTNSLDSGETHCQVCDSPLDVLRDGRTGNTPGATSTDAGRTGTDGSTSTTTKVYEAGESNDQSTRTYNHSDAPTEHTDAAVTCSECGAQHHHVEANYCPRCGAARDTNRGAR